MSADLTRWPPFLISQFRPVRPRDTVLCLSMCLFLCLSLCLLASGASAQTRSMCDRQLLQDAIPPGVPPKGAWRQLYDADGMCIWSRSAFSDQVKEVVVAAQMEAPVEDLANVIMECRQVARVFRDVEACREVRKSGDRVWMFQQLTVPWPARDRYFTVRLERQRPQPGALDVRWRLADQSTQWPAGRGIEAARNEGRWRFRPGEGGGGASVALYYLSVDPGGAIPIPNRLIEYAHQQALPNLIQDFRAAFK